MDHDVKIGNQDPSMLTFSLGKAIHKLKAYVLFARPHHYVKNGFIFLPLFFGHKLYDPQALLPTLFAFIAFCLGASSIYVLNDIHDIEADRQHPMKKYRPLAAGTLSKSEAIHFFFVLLGLSLFISVISLKPLFLLALGAYLLLNVVYTFELKRVAIIDVSCIGVGFVLRVFAGGLAADVWPTHWLILMTFLLALFVALAKRRDDLVLAAGGNKVRRCLDNYSLEFVSLSMVLMAAVILVSYILYTVSPEVISKHKTTSLYLTTFWVILGVLRYMQITFIGGRSGSPTVVLFKDRFLRIVIMSWLLHFFIIFYLLAN